MRGLIVFTALMFACCLSDCALADYSMPAVEEIFSSKQAERLSVIDVEVSGFDAEGRARVSVYGVLLGHFAEGSTLFDVSYACFGGSLQSYGVESGKRYVIFLLGDSMMEEQSRFPVMVEDRVPYVTVSEFYAKWLGLSTPKLSVDALRAHLEGLAKTHRK